MKILVFSDLQAHTFKRYAKYIKFRKRTCNSRLVNIAKAMRYMGNYAVDNDIDYILFAGDLFNERGKIPTESFNFVHHEIKRWLNKGLTVIMVPGNHDCSTKHEEYSMETFQELGENFIFLVNGKVRIHKKWLVVGVGHCEDLGEKIIKASKRRYKGEYKLLLSHFLISGSMNASGFVFDNPMGVGTKELKCFDFCCIGDNHTPQLIKHVLSPGSLVAHDFGDANQERGFWELDLRGNGRVRHVFVPVPAIRFWHKAINKEEDLMIDPDMEYGKDVIKFTIKNSAIGRDSIEEFKKDCPEVIIEFDVPKQITKRLDVSLDKTSAEDCMASYVKNFAGELDKQELLMIGNDIWKEAGSHE